MKFKKQKNTLHLYINGAIYLVIIHITHVEPYVEPM